jgi:hypothetical protein
MGYKDRDNKRTIGVTIEEIDNLLGMIVDRRYEQGLQFKDPTVNKKYLDYLHASPKRIGDILFDLEWKRNELEKKLNKLQ